MRVYKKILRKSQPNSSIMLRKLRRGQKNGFLIKKTCNINKPSIRFQQ